MLSGCACQLATNEMAGEEWITKYPGELHGRDVEFYEVTSETKNEALTTLSSVSIIQIQQKSATWFTSIDLPEQTNGKYYLVRAVYGYLGSGGYGVTYDGSSLFIQHTSLGSCMLYNKSALVVRLSSEPKQVFIGINVAK